MLINQHQLAYKTTMLEGKQSEQNIAQIKETIRVLFRLLANCYRDSDIMETILSHKDETVDWSLMEERWKKQLVSQPVTTAKKTVTRKKNT